MRFFHPNEKYLDYLREFEPKIMSTKGYSHPKFVFGIVFEALGYPYYVPVSSVKELKHLESNGKLKPKYKKTCLAIYGSYKTKEGEKREKVLALLRFDYMFPIPQEETLEVKIDEIDEISYKNLIQKEYLFCKTNGDLISKKALSIYEKAKHPTHYLNGICCDFSLLEVEYSNWIKNKKRWP